MLDPLSGSLKQLADSVAAEELPDFRVLTKRAHHRKRVRTAISTALVAAAVIVACAITGTILWRTSAHHQLSNSPTARVSVSAPAAFHSSTASPFSTSPSTTATPTDAAADAAAGSMTTAGNQLWKIGYTDPNFAGVGVDQEARGQYGYVVFRKDGAGRTKYPSSIDGVPVRIEPVPLSKLDADRAIERILQARTLLIRRGIDIIAAGFDFQAIRITTRNPSEWMLKPIASIAAVDSHNLKLVAGTLPTFDVGALNYPGFDAPSVSWDSVDSGSCG